MFQLPSPSWQSAILALQQVNLYWTINRVLLPWSSIGYKGFIFLPLIRPQPWLNVIVTRETAYAVNDYYNSAAVLPPQFCSLVRAGLGLLTWLLWAAEPRVALNVMCELLLLIQHRHPSRGLLFVSCVSYCFLSSTGIQAVDCS